MVDVGLALAVMGGLQVHQGVSKGCSESELFNYSMF